jgi:hypothetical protein
VQLPETNTLQKALCIVFVVTIGLSILSLGYFFVEKPNRVTVKCEYKGNLEYKMNTITLDPNTPGIQGMQRTKNCTTFTNPPISPNHQLVTDLATVSGISFLLLAIGAYIFRKRDPLDPSDLPTQN